MIIKKIIIIIKIIILILILIILIIILFIIIVAGIYNTHSKTKTNGILKKINKYSNHQIKEDE